MSDLYKTAAIAKIAEVAEALFRAERSLENALRLPYEEAEEQNERELQVRLAIREHLTVRGMWEGINV